MVTSEHVLTENHIHRVRIFGWQCEGCGATRTSWSEDDLGDWLESHFLCITERKENAD